MKITMVKKRLADGTTCQKCLAAEALLRRRGAWKFVDSVTWADESDPKSAGMVLAKRFGVDVAPFFIVGELGDEPTIFTSALKLHRSVLKARTMTAPDAAMSERVAFDAEVARLDKARPQEIVRWALKTHGPQTAIAFSGAEDVAVIDLAYKTGLPFEVFTLEVPMDDLCLFQESAQTFASGIDLTSGCQRAHMNRCQGRIANHGASNAVR